MKKTYNFRDELSKMTPLIAAGAKLYIFGCGTHYAFIKKQIQYLVNIDLDNFIDGFIDNNISLQGKQFHGKTVFALDQIDSANSVVCISTASFQSNYEIGKQLTTAGFVNRHSYFTSEVFFVTLMRWEYLRMEQFHHAHDGERCFIIGNGPSLTVNDLNKLKGEVCFATNRIYLLFPQTDWRPSYFAIDDPDTIKNYFREIHDKIQCPIFYAYNSVFDIQDFNLPDGYFYCQDGRADWYPQSYLTVGFSETPFVLQWGSTVTFICIQLAAYMGFSDIYLLGMDHNFTKAVNSRGELQTGIQQDHFSKDYGNMQFSAQIDVVNAAYRSARQYCDGHGIKIWNATRGGNLEVFERVAFDTLFE